MALDRVCDFHARGRRDRVRVRSRRRIEAGRARGNRVVGRNQDSGAERPGVGYLRQPVVARGPGRAAVSSRARSLAREQRLATQGFRRTRPRRAASHERRAVLSAQDRFERATGCRATRRAKPTRGNRHGRRATGAEPRALRRGCPQAGAVGVGGRLHHRRPDRAGQRRYASGERSRSRRAPRVASNSARIWAPQSARKRASGRSSTNWMRATHASCRTFACASNRLARTRRSPRRRPAS